MHSVFIFHKEVTYERNLFKQLINLSTKKYSSFLMIFLINAAL